MTVELHLAGPGIDDSLAILLALASPDYKVSTDFDRNGNLLHLQRQAAGGVLMDDFTYHYEVDRATGILKHNQLRHVNDAVTGNVGLGLNDLQDQGNAASPNYVYDEIGYNLKPIELQAAMGLEQLKKLPDIHRLRRRNYDLLFAIYQPYEEFFHLPRAQHRSDPSWFAFPLTIRESAPFTRTDLCDYLEDKLIQTRPYFAGNIMLQPAYSHLMDPVRARDDFPNATFCMTNTYFHGTSPVITPEQIAYIGETVHGFMSLYL